jgi:hypothetical protein
MEVWRDLVQPLNANISFYFEKTYCQWRFDVAPRDTGDSL